MLTLAKVKLYGRFKGDMDNLSRAGLDALAAGVTYDEWQEIARLRQALSIVDSGLASPTFVAETEERLHAVTVDEATRVAIRELRE